ALQFRARSEPRVLRCVHPHVGAGPHGIPPFRDGLAVFAFSHGVHPGTPAVEDETRFGSTDGHIAGEGSDLKCCRCRTTTSWRSTMHPASRTNIRYSIGTVT